MKILIINSILHTHEKGVITRRPTNRHTMMYGVARGFVSEGHQVTLIASEDYRPLEEEDNNFEVLYFRSALPRLFRPSVLPCLKGFGRWLRANAGHYDLVISSELFQIPTLTAARICGSKLLVWHELAGYQKFMKQIPAKVWYNMIIPVLMRGVKVVPRSIAAREFVKPFAVNLSDKIVDHGVDEEIFVPAEERNNAFAVISQLIPRKNIEHSIRAFADFIGRPGYAGYRLHIVGDGPQTEELKQLVTTLGIDHAVSFEGFLYSWQWVPAVRGDVALLMATKHDLNTVTIPESIASGLPVLTNEVPLMGQWLDDNGLGRRRANWTADDLEYMVVHRDEMHRNCCNIRSQITNRACAKALLAASR